MSTYDRSMRDPDPRDANLFAAIDDALAGPAETCCRCHAVTTSDDRGFCDECRAFMLGDSAHDPKADGLNARALSGILERIRTGPPLSDQLLAGDAYLVLDGGRMVTGEEAVEIAKRQAGLAS